MESFDKLYAEENWPNIKDGRLLRNILITLFVAFLLLSFIRPVMVDDSVDDQLSPSSSTKKAPTKKLQIGIKKRPEVCERKSKTGDFLHIHYRGYLEDGGAEFDNSYKRGSPLTFTLGQGQVIQGWDKGLLGVCEGEKRKLIIPPDLGYGPQGAPPSIPPNAVLIFEVEVVKIEDRKSEL